MKINRKIRWINGAIVASLLLTLGIWSFLPVVSSQDLGRSRSRKQKKPIFENYDIRNGNQSKEKTVIAERELSKLTSEKRDRLAKRSEVLKEAETKLTKKISRLRVEINEGFGAPEIVGVQKGTRFLTAPSSGQPEKIVRDFIKSNKTLYGIEEQELSQFNTRASYTNPDGNLSWVSLERKLNGLPVFGGEITAVFTKRGELARTVGNLTANLEESALEKAPTVSAQDAIVAGAQTIGVAVDPAALVLKEASADSTSYVFESPSFAREIKIELQYFPLETGVASLSWVMTLWQDSPTYYIAVGADAGDLLYRKNMVEEQTQPATYVVYDSDSPAPLSPSLDFLSATIPSAQGAAVPRTSYTLIDELAANNDPWLPDGATTTSGNNVDSGMDLVSPDGVEAATRAVSATRNFDFSYNPAPGLPGPGDSPTMANYRFGEAVNMFFWTNRYHDRLYEVGFTEAARNFQTSNYGRGGLGNDRVLAEGQDFSGTSNANFLTLPDGQPGRMQMFIFNGPAVDRTSGLDQEILIHELTHGTSNRLHSNASGLSANMSRGMGEGWSDFYARALLSDASENINGIYGTGGYSTLDITAPTAFNSNYYYGIRRFPYALKTTLGANGKPHNPLTFADIDAGKISLTDGAFSRGPIGSSSAHAVHNIGEVWCMALLEVRARIIARTGFAAGNQRMLQLVTDAMKLDPANPTLLDGRNSILAASAASGGGAAEENDIWAGFATRGMGFGATVTPAATTPITVTESFDTPNLTLGTVTVADEDCPDNNGYADPGETVELAVQINNPLATAANGATASIVGGGSASYGTIAGNGSATQDIVYTVPANADCGSIINLTIEIDSSLGPVTKTYALQIGAPTGVSAAVTNGTGNIATPIPDAGTVDIPINVPETGLVGDVNVKMRLNHTFNGDLVVSLIAPDGTAVTLANNRGGSGDNYGSGANDCSGNFTIFDDAAATAISGGTAPFVGSFKPESPLSALKNRQMNGIWKLRVSDTGAADLGTVGCVQLQISQQFYFCCGVEGTPVINAASPAALVAESVAPGNNAPDPDETVTMSFPLKNVGTDLTTNLVATLLPGGGVNAPSGAQAYGVLSPVGSPTARNFTFVPSGNCGENITATFQLQDGATDLGTVSFTIRLGATIVGGATGASTTAIAIPAAGTGATTGSPSNPYPSPINIAGVTGTVTKVTATIANFNHTFPGDVDILLVGPAGQKVVLMSDVGGSTDAVNATLTFDDAAAAIGSTIVSGTFKPTNSGSTDNFPAPAPAAPYGAALSVFDNINPNGAWSLFVVDDASGDVGNINGGWSLTITTADPACASSPCVLNVPANVVQNNDPGLSGAVVNYPAPTVAGGSCGIVTSSPAPGSFFTIGTTPINVSATKQDNTVAATGVFNVTVVDNEAPVITNETVDKPVLWSPNRRLVDIAVSYNVADNFSNAANITRSLSVTSNEPIDGTGDGDTAPDWVIVSPMQVKLRAERSGIGTGRIYTIKITATDQFGNSSFKNVFVNVPHNQ
jgi:subtilisin-like proprotein convertase family protein